MDALAKMRDVLSFVDLFQNMGISREEFLRKLIEEYLGIENGHGVNISVNVTEEVQSSAEPKFLVVRLYPPRRNTPPSALDAVLQDPNEISGIGIIPPIRASTGVTSRVGDLLFEFSYNDKTPAPFWYPDRYQEIAELIYAFWQRRNQFRQMKDAAVYDPLTHCLNRQAILHQLREVMIRVRKNKTKLVVAYADLDGLKLANDGLGHDAGDTLIRRAVDCLTSVSLPDGVGRMGGDEFLFFPKSVDALNALPHICASGVPPVRMSVGVVVMDDASLLEKLSNFRDTRPEKRRISDIWEVVFQPELDALMYKAKKVGRETSRMEMCFNSP